MVRLFSLAMFGFLNVILISHSVYAAPICDRYYQSGKATYYSNRMAGKKTASGQIYNPQNYTAAHGLLPFGTKLWVVNKKNKSGVMLVVNDRGNLKRDGITIDISKIAAQDLGMMTSGHANVDIYACGP